MAIRRNKDVCNEKAKVAGDTVDSSCFGRDSFLFSRRIGTIYTIKSATLRVRLAQMRLPLRASSVRLLLLNRHFLENWRALISAHNGY